MINKCSLFESKVKQHLTLRTAVKVDVMRHYEMAAELQISS
jgi:hypothetical protein